MDVVARVRHTIRRHQLAAPDTAVLVAISGGSDSVALAHLLHLLAQAGELRVAGLAHFNHGLRVEANDDEAFCGRVAAALGCRFVAGREDVRAIAARERRSIEDAARSARYRFFDRARGELGADVVALGHTRDDQAETFLLRLLRGAGARGLASMHPRRSFVVRPLLDCRRTELRAHLAARQLAFVHDTSNDDLAIPRNRVRAELLPFLERFNPSVVDVLADGAALARDEHDYLHAAAVALWPQVVAEEGERLWLDAEALTRMHVALARQLVQTAMSRAAGRGAVSFADVERTLELAAEGRGLFDAPRQRVERIGAHVVLTSRAPDAVGRPTRQRLGAFRYPLPIPGEAVVGEVGCIVSAEVVVAGTAANAGAVSSRAGVAVVQLDNRDGPFAVRNRRPGDRFRVAGAGRRRKLQDFFVDRKIARDRRDRIPIVVDERDRIIWVVGHAVAEEFRVTDPAQSVIILRLKALGGSA
jgi:tRNA(Ile)-lysidine synthase